MKKQDLVLLYLCIEMRDFMNNSNDEFTFAVSSLLHLACFYFLLEDSTTHYIWFLGFLWIIGLIWRFLVLG